MTTYELRKFASAWGGIHDIVNNIKKEAVHELVPAPEWVKKITGKDEWYETYYVPRTDSYLWSNWKVCVKVMYRGVEMYMWFRPFKHSDNSYDWIAEYTWNGGPGKKLRRDAHRNLYWRTMEKVGLFVYENEHWVVKSCDRQGNIF